MPYIKKEDRKKFDVKIADLAREIETEGELNYVITKICLRWLYKHKVCYSVLNSIIGVLFCVIQEFYRRIVSIYEDNKIEENGDVFDNDLDINVLKKKDDKNINKNNDNDDDNNNE